MRAGRRSGKTTGVARLAVEEFLAGHRILYGVPTTEQLGKFWKEVRRALAEPIEHGAFYKNETEHIIELPGSEQRIKGKTAWNADTLRGDYADIIILDEFQLMDENAWGEVGAPMLIDNNGVAIFIYTPPSLHSRSVSKAKDIHHAPKLFKRALEDQSGRWLALHFTSHDNPYISPEGIEEVSHDMTRLAYQQEILAQDATEVPGALWKMTTPEGYGLDDLRVEKIPAEALPFLRIVVGIDPSGGSVTEAGIVAAGMGRDGHGYVLKDASLVASSPKQWAAAAVALYHDMKADRILGERNYGGDMVETTVRLIDENVSYSDVLATRGKLVRAEPICAMYEQKRVHHVGQFPELENEMCSYVPGDKSPNRMDAAVWALTELLLGNNVLGVVEYLREGAAARQLKELNTTGKIQQPTSLIKPVTDDKTPSCPECASQLVRLVPGGGQRCQQCGVQWGGSRPVDGQPTRAQMLAKAK